MDDPRYLSSLNHGSSIAVLLGHSSNGLCTIDIDSDAAMEQFLALNPKLRSALRTKRVRGGNIWVRIPGRSPASTLLKLADGTDWGELRADNRCTMIYGHAIDKKKGETKPTLYKVIQRGAPAEISFDEINWPDGLQLPWLDSDLVQRYGEPYDVTKNGRVILNQAYFVGRFASEHLVIYEPDERQFYSYDGTSGLWQRQTGDAIKNQFSIDFGRHAKDFKEPQLISLRTNALLTALVELLRGEVERRGVFDTSRHVIHLANGMLHLDCEPPELRGFKPDYYSRNQCPVAYRDGADCPRFKSELLGTAMDDDDISLLQRVAGLWLIGRNLTQRLLLVTGTAGGGKSTFLSILERIVGVINVAEIRTNLLLDRFELHSFVGKTLLTGKDVSANFLSQRGASALKKLCGGDLIDAEAKFNNTRIQMKGHFNIGITCNSRLRVKLEGDAAAWGRRIIPVPYERAKPDKPIRDFEEILLREEGPGILNWMIEGAVQHLRELAEHGDFVLTPRQQERIDALLSESDSVRSFVQNCLTRDEGSDVTTEELNAAYRDYCDARGWDALATRQVETQLPDLILERFRIAKRNDIPRGKGKNRGYSHLGIKGGEEA
jgi:P4 family phage/plasmid primase-like protien